MSALEVTYLIAPLLVAGIVHAPIIKRNYLPGLARPLDGGRTFRGRPVLGANKTWRGPLVMSAVAIAVVFVQHELYALAPFRAISIIDYRNTSWIGLGLALGLGYSLFELPNSFVKRSLGIPPGGVSAGRARVQYVVDQADSVLGGTLALTLFLGLRVWPLVLVFALGFTFHVIVDQLYFLFAVKRQAAPSPIQGTSA
jgi:CDP-2,3-bis-(O-geranylgeranyl)-sn-glycerol synthase